MRFEVVEPTKEESKYITSLFPIIKEVKNEDIRKKVIQVWVVLLHNGKFKKIEDLPLCPPIGCMPMCAR